MNRKMTRHDFASARVSGSRQFPDIHGKVSFSQTEKGVFVTAEIYGLPEKNEYGADIFAFHIHEGGSCTGKEGDPFSDVGSHYNPKGAPHPFHAGDLPPLFGNHGYAFMNVLTDRFKVSDIIGRSVIIHRQPDDFTTQPSGNAGEKIACGKIVRR